MGQLTQTVSLSSAAVNLTSVGLVDWSDWGTSASLTASDYKSGGGHTIPNPTMIGPSPVLSNYTNDPRTISWTNGTNTGSSSNTDGIYNSGATSGDGLQLVLPADTSVRTIYIYIGGYSVTPAATISASLSDSSASSTSDSTTFVGASNTAIDGVIQLVYQANSASQTLTVQMKVNGTASFTNVALQAAALASVVSGVPPSSMFLTFP